MIRFLLTTLLTFATGFAQTAPAKHKVFFNRFRLQELSIMIADADGRNERPLVPHGTLEYSPSYSADGKWVVFTKETAGLSDIYRVHPDGSDLEKLTDDPAFDDQGVLSPDGRTLAFVSTLGSGTANLWLLELASRKYTNLTGSQTGNFRPAWSPDGAWIAFQISQGVDADSRSRPFKGQSRHVRGAGGEPDKRAQGGELASERSPGRATRQRVCRVACAANAVRESVRREAKGVVVHL